MQIPITKPYLDESEKQAVCDVIDSGWLVQGSRVAEFEKSVCEYTGAIYARATSSCTTALHLALIALGIGSGDEVLVPSFTFIASANAIEYTGARPVFVDIDLDTFNIDPDKASDYLEKDRKSNRKVKAIMPVHLFGLAADMEQIQALSREHDLKIIEDAACALGSTYKARHAGTFGDAGCFSFHPRKPITVGEGGMVITGHQQIASKIDRLRDHGAGVTDFARHEHGGALLPEYEILGYNYRMTDLQGAIGIEQMKKLDWVLNRRIELANRYNEELEKVEWLQTPHVPGICRHTYQSYVVCVGENKPGNPTVEYIEKLNGFRNSVADTLKEMGIATRQGTHAVHDLDYYSKRYKLEGIDYINSLAADRLSITIPLYPQMTDEEQEYVIDNIKKIEI